MRKPDGYGPVPGTDRPPCEADPELFFADYPRALRKAVTLCQGCPIKTPCYEGARERREPFGVWGGVLFQAGVPMSRATSRMTLAATAHSG